MNVDPIAYTAAAKALRKIPYDVAAGEYWLTEPYGQLVAASMTLSGMVLYSPLFIPSDDCGLAALSMYVDTPCSVTGAGGRIGLYADVDSKPGPIIADLGTVGYDGSAGMVTAVYSGSKPKRGPYWAGVGLGNTVTALKLICYAPGHWYHASIGSSINSNAFSTTIGGAGFIGGWTPGGNMPTNPMPTNPSGLLFSTLFSLPVPRVLPLAAA